MMFLRHLSIKGGIPLFAHRFYFKFEVYLIKGSSIFLKIGEPPKKIIKDKRTLFLEGIYKVYSLNKELFLGKLIEELKKNPAKRQTIVKDVKILDKKLDNLTVDVLTKRIDTVENKVFSIYGVEKVVDKVADKSILNKVVHTAENKLGELGFTLNKLNMTLEYGIDNKQQLYSIDSTVEKKEHFSLIEDIKTTGGILKREDTIELSNPNSNINILDYKEISEYRNSTGISKESDVFLGKDKNIDIMVTGKDKHLSSSTLNGLFIQTDKQVGIGSDDTVSGISIKETGNTGLNKGGYNITANNIYAHYLKNGITETQLNITLNIKGLTKNNIDLLEKDVSPKFIKYDDIKASISKAVERSIKKNMDTPIANFFIPFHLVGNDIREMDRSLVTYTLNIGDTKQVMTIVDKVALERYGNIDLSILSNEVHLSRNISSNFANISKIMNDITLKRNSEIGLSLSEEIQLTKLTLWNIMETNDKLGMIRLPAFDDLSKSDNEVKLKRNSEKENPIYKSMEDISLTRESGLELFKSDILVSARKIPFIHYSNDVVTKFLKNTTLIGTADTNSNRFASAITRRDLSINESQLFLDPLLISNAFHEVDYDKFLANISRKDFSIQNHMVYFDKLKIENAFTIDDTVGLKSLPISDMMKDDSLNYLAQRTFVPLMKPMEYHSLAQRTFVPIMLTDKPLGFNIYQRDMNYNLGDTYNLKPRPINHLFMSPDERYMVRDILEPINMNIMKDYPVSKYSIRDIIIRNPVSLDNAGLTEMSMADYFSVKKDTERPMFIDTYTSLSDFNFVGITKDKNRLLENITLIPIVAEKYRALNKFKATDINIEKARETLKNIELRKSTNFDYNNSVQFLKLNKRWWFIRPTNLKTKINIPVIDYPYEQEPILGVTKHPIEDFTNMGMDDINISVEIVLELVNIVMHWWHHSYNDLFSGMGDEAVQGLMSVLFDWYNLASSQEQRDKQTNEEYERVFRWIRWEAEKVYFDFKNDSENNLIYNGNYYIEILTRNLLEYVEYHHYMVVPMYKSLKKMDIMRAIMGDDPQGDIMTELPDKIKGDRNYTIDGQDDNYSL